MDAMNVITKKRKRKGKAKASTPEDAPPLPKLPDEIVVDQILVRLPVKTLLRFRSVCKAWQAIIANPVFIRAHLRSSASNSDQDPTFLITPITFDSHIRFYQWQQGADDSNNGGVKKAAAARLMHAKDLTAGDGEVSRFYSFSHCDGLVLVPTDTKFYLFNPATRDAITLPDSQREDLWHRGAKMVCHGGACLGRDPRTGEYKVVRPFFRDVHAGGGNGGGGWRETRTHPPYPVVSSRWEADPAGLHIKGFMYWRIDAEHHDSWVTPRGLLRLSLADERFRETYLPESMARRHPALGDVFELAVLRGEELCLSQQTACSGDGWAVAVWTMKVDDDGRHGQWEQSYDIRCRYPCDPMALVDGGSRLLLRRGCVIYEHDLERPEDDDDDEVTTVCELDRIRSRIPHLQTTFRADPNGEKFAGDGQ
ncbi:hypothetical protein HU200_005982 [Digitaria exilis]|uniref:F-box domain-containing protein n=1 Tax=Digitaria exilis TaxID=1010633 RepID=A0A835FT26_9POAL|nr:hypothetical protein HU200_005982 [Digitaria exilis]